ncbi:hypothetical protein V1506DRAFT_507590 [Lipomyces tetrasporus]
MSIAYPMGQDRRRRLMMDPPQRRPTARAKAYAIKRQQIFEEKKAPGQIQDRTDWNQVVRREKAQRTMDKYLMVLDWFEDFSVSRLHLPEGDSKKYFRRNGPRPSISLVRQFFTWIAQTHRGNAGNDKIRLSTIGGYLDTLWGAMKFFNSPFPTNETEQHKIWLIDVLAPQEELNLLPEDKAVAYPKDVTFLISNLFRPEVLAKFPSMHQALQFVLLLNLNIDLMGRIGELIFVGIRPDDADENTITEPWLSYLLIWRRVTFWAHLQDDGSIKFSVVLRITGMKGQKRTPGLFKEVPLQSLSPEAGLEDSCRLILYLAILEGHLEIDSLDGLASIQRLRTTRTGTKLQIKESSLDIPVFQQSTLSGELTGKPMGYHPFHAWLNLVSRAAGIVDTRVTSRCMRRAVAYYLNRSTDIDSRKQLMGHRENSRVFSAYQAKTAQVDTQAILRGAPETDITMYSSIVNGSIPGAPLFLSAAGLRVVASSPSMVEAHNILQATLQELLKEFPNVASAKSASSPLYEAYRQAQRTKKNLQFVMNRVQFAAEVREFAQKHKYALLEPNSTTADDDAQDDLLEQENINSAAEGTASSSTLSYEEEADALQAYQGEPSHNPISTTRDYYIDPQLLEVEDSSNDARREESANTDISTAVVITNPDEPDPSTLRRHHVTPSRDMINKCPRPTVADGVFQRVTEGSLSHEEVDNLLMPLLSIKHPLTRYPSHLMPVPGTKDCCFCGVSWDDWEIDPNRKYESRFVHVKQCAQTAAKVHVRAKVEHVLETAFKETPNCPWIRGKPLRPCPEKDFLDASAWAAHLFEHRNSSKTTCRIGECGVRLTSLRTWRAHAWEKHQIPFEGIIEDLVQWCEWCEDCIIAAPGSEAEEAHFSTHIEHAINSVKKYGYGGCHDGTRPLVPGKCVFCLHDRGLPSKDRLFYPFKTWFMLTHLQLHLRSKKVDSVDLSVMKYCPASEAAGTDFVLCSCDDAMEIPELRDHLTKVHGIDCPGDSFETHWEKTKRLRAEKNLASSRTVLSEKSTNAIVDQRLEKRQKPSPTDSAREKDDAVSPMDAVRVLKQPSAVGLSEKQRGKHRMVD